MFDMMKRVGDGDGVRADLREVRVESVGSWESRVVCEIRREGGERREGWVKTKKVSQWW